MLHSGAKSWCDLKTFLNVRFASFSASIICLHISLHSACLQALRSSLGLALIGLD